MVKIPPYSTATAVLKYLVPRYSTMAGKLGLERGGIYAIANIRGGGEFVLVGTRPHSKKPTARLR